MKVLFIGNSHTYYNDMPQLFKSICDENGLDCDVTMIAHGGWFLSQHAEEPEVKFNILYGHYDYIVLQEHAHPFGPVENMIDAAKTIAEWIRQAGSVPVAYMTWAEKDAEQLQPEMTEGYQRMAAEINAIIAPVGVRWWEYHKQHPEVELYAQDGAHASAAGSRFAAEILYQAIEEYRSKR